MEKTEARPGEESMPLWKSHYSSNFNSLFYLGAWPVEVESRGKMKAYRVFQVFMSVLTVILIGSLCKDLMTVFGSIKKMAWNLCVNSLYTGAVIKLVMVYMKRNVVNELREKLHRSMESRSTEEDILIQTSTVTQLRKTRRFMYSCACSFGSIWLVSRYRTKYTEQKQMPIPLYVPESFDLNVDVNFDVAFITFSIIGTGGLFFIVEQEMAMFSILLQIKREYDILLKDIRKLNEVKEIGEEYRHDGADVANLPDRLIKCHLKELCIRQQTVMGFTDDFEYCYNHAMVVQILVIMILSVSIGLQCIMFSKEYLTELAFQVGYLAIVLTDMFLLSFMGSTLSSQCREIGHALYDTFWYATSPKTQKDLLLMVLTSQRPPRITCLKAVEVDLNAFMNVMKNVYSWLALFRQVAYKTNL